MAKAALLVVACGCGRVGFDALPAPAGDAPLGGDGSADAALCSTITSVDWLATPMPLDASKAYAISADGLTVLDATTGLRWERNVPAGTFTQLQALSHCAGLTLNGCAHWRLPERIELASIVDHEHASPTINPTVFPNTPIDTYFWTGTPQVSANNFWEINFDNGNTAWNSDTTAYHVRCVHSEVIGTPPPARYTIGASTVVDNQTGLTWLRAADPSTETKANAQTYCAGVAWRLPEVQELETIIDTARSSPAVDPTAFPSLPSARFWTNSSYITNVSMTVDLTSGSIINATDSSSFNVLCLR